MPTGVATAIIAQDLPDPGVEKLRHMESLNIFHCDILTSNGLDGSLLRKEAPKRETYVAITQPVSTDRVNAIRKAQTTGALFYATGGRHTNSNEFFQARELKRREPEIKEMEKKKKERMKYCSEQVQAVQMIKRKGELTWLREKDFTIQEIEILLKWKKVKIKSKRKADLIQAYVDAPKPRIQQNTWTTAEESSLNTLKSEVVSLRQTAVGVAAVQMAKAVTNNVAQLDTPTRESLKRSLLQFEEENAPNAI